MPTGDIVPKPPPLNTTLRGQTYIVSVPRLTKPAEIFRFLVNRQMHCAHSDGLQRPRLAEHDMHPHQVQKVPRQEVYRIVRRNQAVKTVP